MKSMGCAMKLRTALYSLLAALIVASSAQAGGRLFYRKPFVPLDLNVPGQPVVVSAWWSAQDYGTRMTDDGSGLISSWKDRITALAVTGTTTARPTYGATSFNSAYPGVTFDGVANTLATTTLTALPTGATAGEVWYVGSATSNASTSTFVAYGAQGGAIQRILRKNTADGGIISDNATSITMASAATPHIVSGNWSGTAENGWLDGVAAAENPKTIATLNTTATRLRIGAGANTAANLFYTGTLSDILVITTVLSTSDRQKLEGYLAWNRGLCSAATCVLAASHPYRWAAP